MQTDESPVVRIKDIGLTKISGSDSDKAVLADVVFVHGLQGHPKRTWQSKASAEASERRNKRFRLDILGTSRSNDSSDSHAVFWPADLLAPRYQNIRILTYGYDSMVTQGLTAPASKNGIFQHGNSLLRSLDRVRGGCPSRPIIFVAHSLGGLVVKQVLIEARKQSSDESLLDIYKSAHAVIFFGIPHRGSNMASWGLLLSAFANAIQIDTNNAILRDLDPSGGSTKLDELNLDFDGILRDSTRSKELRVYSFQEELGMAGVRGFGKKVR